MEDAIRLYLFRAFYRFFRRSHSLFFICDGVGPNALASTGGMGFCSSLIGLCADWMDAFYRLQAWFFGSDNHWQTIVKKVLVDQFVYCILWASPVTHSFTSGRRRTFPFPNGVGNGILQSARQNHRLYGLDLDRLDSRHRDRLFATFAPADSPVQPHPLLFVLLVSVFSRKNGNPSRPPAEEA